MVPLSMGFGPYLLPLRQSEILLARLGNPNIGFVFPGYTDFEPLGLMKGTLLPPVYDETPHRVYIPLAIR